MYKNGGYTIVEVAVVIAVIGILATVTLFSVRGLDVKANDRERESDATSIARQVELVYNNQTLGTPTYPGTTSVDATSTRDSIFGGKQADITRAPSQTSFSIVKATNATATTAGVLPQPTKTTYVFQPLTLAGALCSSSCSKFNLYYYQESTNTVVMIKSLKQQ
ncbi:MAG: prepilin-type N-terminal cleavage/methylation domain-containing protein [Candidatus Microsaccharimonas sp.]